MIGKTLAHYEIQGLLGKGGMGEVYRARDAHLERDVAIKVLPPHLLDNPELRKRFRKEALSLSRLNHPNIATVFDFDSENGTDFLVMEYVPGLTLSDKLASGPLPETEILDLGQQLCEGLKAAHTEGVIHRDLKPANLRVTDDGRLKILDFGLAKLAHANEDLTKTETMTAGIVGTVPYMSPEQLRGLPADARTDLHAMGLVLYEMATGQRRHAGIHGAELIEAILNRDPPNPRSLQPGLSNNLETVILKAIARDPAQRYQSAGDLGHDVEQMSLGLRVATRRPRTSKNRIPIAAALLVATMIALFVWRGWLRPESLDSVAVLPFVDDSEEPGQEYFSAGMTDVLIDELMKIPALKVIARTSVQHYQSTDRTLPEIGRELGVDAIVEASISRSGDQVRISARLIRADTEQQLWSDSYVRSVVDVLSLQAEVARAIAAGIRVKLTPEETERLSRERRVDPEAFEACLKGRYYLDTWEDFEKAIEHFREAIDIDPTYAVAYAGLAEAYSQRNFVTLSEPLDAARKSRAAVEQALKLDDSLGGAHAILGWLKFSYDWDWFGPEENFQRALQLSPGSPAVYELYRLYLGIVGRHDEAIAMARRALDLDPLTETRESSLVWCFWMAERYDEARELIERKRKTGSTSPYPWSFPFLEQIYIKQGRQDEALATVDSVLAVYGEEALAAHSIGTALISSIYASVGRTERAREIIALHIRAKSTGWLDPYYVAESYAGLGEADSTLAWLERGYAERTPSMVFAGKPNFDFLDGDPRYEALLAKVGIPVERAHDRED